MYDQRLIKKVRVQQTQQMSIKRTNLQAVSNHNLKTTIAIAKMHPYRVAVILSREMKKFCPYVASKVLDSDLTT